MRRPVARALTLATSACALAACGGTPKHATKYGIFVENLPKQTTFRLSWNEHVAFEGTKMASFRVGTLSVGPNGWRASVSFRNDSDRPLKLPTGTKLSPKSFGLGVFATPTSSRVEEEGNYFIRAAKIIPAMPAVLKPGATWSGTLSSPEPPRARRYLHVIFGVFFWQPKPPPGLGPFFAWSTTHMVRVPGPQGLPKS